MPLASLQNSVSIIKLGKPNGTTPFSISSTISLPNAGTKYYLRAYISNAQGATAYSKEVAFETKKGPTIVSFAPTSTNINAIITIEGRDFGNNPFVTLSSPTTNNVVLSPTTFTSSRFNFVVPEDLVAGNYSITLSDGINTTQASNQLAVNATVTEYPTTAAPTESWFIRGTGFGRNLSLIDVNIANTKLVVNSVSPNLIVCTLPNATGSFVPSITINGQRVAVTQTITLRR